MLNLCVGERATTHRDGDDSEVLLLLEGDDDSAAVGKLRCNTRNRVLVETNFATHGACASVVENRTNIYITDKKQKTLFMLSED